MQNIKMAESRVLDADWLTEDGHDVMLHDSFSDVREICVDDAMRMADDQIAEFDRLQPSVL